MNPPSVLILANKDTTILNFRLSLIVALREAGYRVVVALPPGERVDEIRAVGADICLTPMKKDAVTPAGDVRLIRTYRYLMDTLAPAVVMTYTVKPTVFGGIAARSGAIRKIPLIATITGRGRLLAEDSPLRSVGLWLYRYALQDAAAVCFQNTADRADFARHRIGGERYVLLPGSGVDLDRFTPALYPACGQGTAFAFISRLLPEKGVDRYIEVARRVRVRHPETVFHVAGFGDAATEARMEKLAREGVIVYHGHLRDIRPLLSSVHALIHPTTYPEGMANILLEAAATARPVITTDRPGSCEAVENGVTGFLVPPRDTDSLEAAVETFLTLSDSRRARMGLAGRRKMEAEFDRRLVVARYLELIRACAPEPAPRTDIFIS